MWSLPVQPVASALLECGHDAHFETAVPWAEPKMKFYMCSSPSLLHATTANSGCQVLVFRWMCFKEFFDCVLSSGVL